MLIELWAGLLRNKYLDQEIHVQLANPNPDDDASRHSVEQIWQLGCAGEPLSDHDWEHFVSLARNRFYTFQLGCQHAMETKQPDKTKALQAGLVSELMPARGLEKLWLASEFQISTAGSEIKKLIRRRRFKEKFRFV